MTIVVKLDGDGQMTAAFFANLSSHTEVSHRGSADFEFPRHPRQPLRRVAPGSVAAGDLLASSNPYGHSSRVPAGQSAGAALRGTFAVPASEGVASAGGPTVAAQPLPPGFVGHRQAARPEVRHRRRLSEPYVGDGSLAKTELPVLLLLSAGKFRGESLGGCTSASASSPKRDGAARIDLPG